MLGPDDREMQGARVSLYLIRHEALVRESDSSDVKCKSSVAVHEGIDLSPVKNEIMEIWTA